jgi:uncharacterized protein
MNTAEREQLSQFLKQLSDAKLAQKDPEADSLIRDAAAHQPDALYLLTQRALLLEHALNQSKQQIADLQNQLSRQGQSGAFLQNDPWAQPAANAQGVPGAGNYQVPRYQAAPNVAPAAQNFGGTSSFLGNVATTAAGVVAGSFLFQGIENLMGHHSSPWGGSGFGGSGFDQPENVTINNYYGDDDANNGNDFADNNQTDVFPADYSADNDFGGGSDDSDWI